MTATISATAAARNLSDLLNRVLYRGESFVIVRNGVQVARLSPAPERAAVSLAEAVERLAASRTGDPRFADDLERIQAEQPPPGEGRW
jgi:prevent-host-death family protein